MTGSAPSAGRRCVRLPPRPTAWAHEFPGAVAGMLAVALVTVFVLRGGGGREITLSPPPAGGGEGAPVTALGPTNAVDLDSMTPRQAASRLFNRVMTAVEAGDQAQASMFLPMAIASYDLIAALSLDDRFHLSLLHATAGNGELALAIAEEGLAQRPTHLLCLAAAAQGALLIGDGERAAAHYRTFLDVYEEELQAGAGGIRPGPGRTRARQAPADPAGGSRSVSLGVPLRKVRSS